jgi:phosphohistidine phosphatase
LAKYYGNSVFLLNILFEEGSINISIFMKQLLLMRHAKSDWSSGVKEDIDRPLNRRGRNDTPIIGEELLRRNAVPDLILSSPAVRAMQTADLLSKSCGFSGEVQWINEFYNGDMEQILQHVKKIPENVGRLMIIGHNPVFELLASNLISNKEADVILPTASVISITVSISLWNDLELHNNKLDWIITPKQLKKEGGKY